MIYYYLSSDKKHTYKMGKNTEMDTTVTENVEVNYTHRDPLLIGKLVVAFPLHKKYSQYIYVTDI